MGLQGQRLAAPMVVNEPPGQIQPHWVDEARPIEISIRPGFNRRI
jgi:hypothetical protein